MKYFIDPENMNGSVATLEACTGMNGGINGKINGLLNGKNDLLKQSNIDSADP